MTVRRFDVAVVGASIAGCTAAILFARRGLSVALFERTPDPLAFKKVCTHYLQPMATPVLRKLGLDRRIEAAGGLRNELEVFTEWGWIRAEDPTRLPWGYNIRRQTLDPLLRQQALETPGVSFFGAAVCRELLRDGKRRPCGVVVDTPSGRQEFLASLVVGADGRNSQIAKLTNSPTERRPNDRFTYYAYYRGVPQQSSANSQYWHLDPHLAYAFRNDDDTLLLGAFFPKCEQERFKKDPLGEFRRFWSTVPNAPDLGDAQPICEMRGMLDMPNQRRPAASCAVALVGDAAMTTDPIWGAGCGFAFTSADWLVEQVAPPLLAGAGPAEVDKALGKYRRIHRARTRDHFWHIASFSRIRGPNLLERLVFSAAVHDDRTARRVLAYFGRTTSLASLLSPTSLARAAAVNLGRWNRPKRLAGAAKRLDSLAAPWRVSPDVAAGRPDSLLSSEGATP